MRVFLVEESVHDFVNGAIASCGDDKPEAVCCRFTSESDGITGRPCGACFEVRWQGIQCRAELRCFVASCRRIEDHAGACSKFRAPRVRIHLGEEALRARAAWLAAST